MPEGIPIPGKGPKPTQRSVRRAQVGARQDIRLPDKEYQAREDEPGRIACPACHAISTGKRWFFLIRNETATAAHEDNPLHRLKILDEGPEELHLVTATGHLAERIGKAFRGLWHADDLHPQGSIRVRLLKSAVRRNAAHRNQMEWPSP